MQCLPFKKNLKVAGLQGGLAAAAQGSGGGGRELTAVYESSMSDRSAEYGDSS